MYKKILSVFSVSMLSFVSAFCMSQEDRWLQENPATLEKNPREIFSQDTTTGMTALHIVAENGWAKVTKKFLETFDTINAQDMPLGALVRKYHFVNARNNKGQTPYDIAQQRGHQNVMQILIAAGAQKDDQERAWLQQNIEPYYADPASIYKKDENGNTILHIAANQGWLLVVKLIVTDFFIRSQAQQHKGILETLINQPVFVSQPNCNGQTPLDLALKGNHVEIIQFLLQFFKNAPDDMTCLHRAAMFGHPATAHLFINSETDINCKNNKAETPLMLAIKFGNKEMAALLINAHADLLWQDTEKMTLLHIAALSDDPEMIQFLADHKLALDSQDIHGKTPLCCAAEKGNIKCVEKLISLGARVDIQDKEHKTAFYRALMLGHEKVVALFIEKDPSVITSQEFDGKSLLHRAIVENNVPTARILIAHNVALEEQHLLLAAEKGATEIAQLLIDSGIDIAVKTSQGHTPLYLALRNGHNAIVDMLVAHGEDINKTDCKGRTLLHKTVEENDLPATEALIAHKVLIDKSDIEGKTPLFIAAEAGNKEMVKCLLAHGASLVNGPLNICRFLPLLLDCGAQINEQTSQGTTLLHRAVAENNIPAIEDILTSKPDVNVRDKEGRTALFLACFEDKEDIAMTLLDAGADVKLQNTSGLAPLHAVSFRGNCKLAKACLAKHADINQPTNEDTTPLHFAVNSQDEDIVKLLVDAGADLSREDKKGETAFYLAAKQGISNVDVAVYLCKHIRDINASGKKGITLLEKAVQDECLEAIKIFVTSCGVNINKGNLIGKTPLHRAVAWNKMRSLQCLIQLKAQPNNEDNKGYTPLDIAFETNNVQAANMLLDAGALCSFSPKKDGQQSLLSLLFKEEVNIEMIKALLQHNVKLLYQAILESNITATHILLSQFRLSLDQKNIAGKTPLFIAAEAGNKEMVKCLLAHGASLVNGPLNICRFLPLLLDCGAQINEQTSQGTTLLHRAVAENNMPAIEDIFACKPDVNKTDRSGNSALHLAVAASRQGMVRTLLDHGANVNQLDGEGCSALYRADINQNNPLRKMLMQHGARYM
jgi:ankyrin repeat protein